MVSSSQNPKLGNKAKRKIIIFQEYIMCPEYIPASNSDNRKNAEKYDHDG